MNLPSPENYKDWRDWAKALTNALSQSNLDLDAVAGGKAVMGAQTTEADSANVGS